MRSSFLYLIPLVLTMNGCSEDAEAPTACTALVDGRKWEAKDFQSVSSNSSNNSNTGILKSLIATSDDGSSLIFNIERMNLSPDNLTAEFRSKTATISYFRATLTENFVNLEWGTSSESNVYAFEIEVSYDDGPFLGIGSIYAVGFSEDDIDYSFSTHIPLIAEDALYRIKVINYDGTTTVTDPIHVKLTFEVYYRDAAGVRYGGHNGKVQLTNFDKTARSISGNFFFDYTSAGREIQVRDGVLKNVNY